MRTNKITMSFDIEELQMLNEALNSYGVHLSKIATKDEQGHYVQGMPSYNWWVKCNKLWERVYKSQHRWYEKNDNK